MYLAMYKNESSSSGLGALGESSAGNDGSDEFSAIEGSFMGDVGSETIAFDDHVAGEEGSEESLSVEEPIDETFVWRKERLDPELNELGDADWSDKLELEKAHGLGVGWMSHWENSSGTVRPCVYWSFRCQQSVGVCP